jgi:hypothetical protein
MTVRAKLIVSGTTFVLKKLLRKVGSEVRATSHVGLPEEDVALASISGPSLTSGIIARPTGMSSGNHVKFNL